MVTALLAGPALAQPCAPIPGTGDLLLTEIPPVNMPRNSPVFRLNPISGLRSSVGFIAQPHHGNWVAMDQDNSSIVCSTGAVTFPFPTYPTGPFVRMLRSGARQTILELPTTSQSHELDQDGTWLCALANGNASFPFPRTLLRVNPNTGTATTIVTNGAARGTFNAVCLDGDTGDFMIGLFDDPAPGGALLRIDRLTSAITTVAAGLGRISTIDFEPATGTFAVGRFDPPELLRVTPGGEVTTIATIPNVNALKVHDETGNLAVAGGADVSILTSAGVVVGTRTIDGYSLTGVEIDGSRKVSGSGTFAAGQVYTIRFSFPLSPCASYVAALSGSLRPGLALADGRTIHLAADPFFLMSVGGLPGLTTGFAGTLDTSGRAAGALTPPAWWPAGIRLYVSAVAVNPALPNGLDTANSLGVTSQ
jgi:hypothetical protein